MTTRRTAFIPALFLVFLAASGYAQRMPQDSWYLHAEIGGSGSGDGQFSSVNALAIASNGWIYAADNGNSRIQVFTADGVFTQKWTASCQDLDFGPDGLLYALAGQVRVYTADGVLTNQWGSGLSGGLTVATNGLVYVADTADDKIRVFTLAGTPVTNWGESGMAPHQFGEPGDVAVGVDGNVWVTDLGQDYDWFKQFTPEGQFIRQVKIEFSGFGDRVVMDIGPDGLMACTDSPSIARVLDVNLSSLAYLKPEQYGYHEYTPFGSDVASIAFGNDGSVALGFAVSDDSYKNVYVFRRAYRTTGLPTWNAPPMPVVYQARQRVGTTIMDVDFAVRDVDSPNATVAALAFVDGGNTLADVLRMNTFVDGTESNINCQLPANEKKRLSWNVAADWNTDLGQMQVEILAKDRPGVVDVHYITIPSNGPDPELTISRSPIIDSDVLPYWYWLVATNDPAIILSSGQVYGVSGVYSGKVLAATSATTADGYAFVFERMNVRQATTSEVARAREATTPGTVNAWTPRFSVGPRRFPKKLNEYGFDTGYSASLRWVVPLP